jgi:hypothetical protein
MAEENAGWGAPKIHGELQKLGFELSERPWLDTCGEFVVGVIPVSAG